MNTETIGVHNDVDLTRIDIVRLQGSPMNFFKLPRLFQDNLLESVVGRYVGNVYEWVDYKTRSSFSNLFPPRENFLARAQEITLYEQLMHCLAGSKFDGVRALRLMRFFQVETFSYVNYRPYGLNVEFLRWFPFGCFSVSIKGPRPTSTSLDQNEKFINHWLLGVEVLDILDSACSISKVPSRDDFLWILNGCDVEGVKVSEVVDQIVTTNEKISKLLRSVVNQGTGILIEEAHVRVQRIMEKLSMRALKYSKGEHPYLFMYNSTVKTKQFGNVNVQMLMGVSRYIKKPTWSKDMHRFMDREFRKIALTILLMQKYRSNAFPLHKDLLTLFLGYLFDVHLDWLYHGSR